MLNDPKTIAALQRAAAGGKVLGAKDPLLSASLIWDPTDNEGKGSFSINFSGPVLPTNGDISKSRMIYSQVAVHILTDQALQSLVNALVPALVQGVLTALHSLDDLGKAQESSTEESKGTIDA